MEGLLELPVLLVLLVLPVLMALLVLPVRLSGLPQAQAGCCP